MNNRNFLVFILLLASFLWLNGCVTVYQSNATPPAPPAPPIPVWAVYFPSPEIPPNGTIRPIPAYQGWTNLRMERDLARMAEAKFTAALVVTTHLQLLSDEFLERYRKFAELAEPHSIQVALLVRSLTQPAPAMERGNISQYLSSKGYLDIPSALRTESGVRILLIDEDFVLDAPSPELDQTVCIWQIGHEVPALPSGPLDIPSMRADANGVLWIRAADNSGCAPYNRARPTDDWTIRRRNGAPLKRQLDQARVLNAKLLLLDSWNDYSRGSFVENNTLDQDALLKLLKNR